MGLGWAAVDLDECRVQVQGCLSLLRTHADLIGKLLIWEIGKTYKAGFTDIDWAIEGVYWYVDHTEGLLGSRTPLGLSATLRRGTTPCRCCCTLS
jgi:acyl-CoA reductase-like NAD-dependent aldehyde dehydrogenase